MNWVDFAIIALIALSALVGLSRGFIREMLSLVVWACALLLAWIYYPWLEVHLESWIASGSVRMATAFVTLVFGALVIGTLIGSLLTNLIDRVGLTGTDRLLGGLFGAVRGGLLIAMSVFLAALTPLPEDAWWGESAFIGRFQVLAERVLSEVPPELVDRVKHL